MKCPRCQDSLSAKTYENVAVNNCKSCGGLWLDVGNLQPILAAHDVNFSPDLIEKTLKEAHTGIPKADVDALLQCPICSKYMNALNYNYSSGVILHACPIGQGLWFDKDELAAVQIYMEHWNEEETKNQSRWIAMERQARQDELAALDKEDALSESKEGPLARTIDAIFDRFEKMGSKNSD